MLVAACSSTPSMAFWLSPASDECQVAGEAVVWSGVLLLWLLRVSSLPGNTREAPLGLVGGENSRNTPTPPAAGAHVAPMLAPPPPPAVYTDEGAMCCGSARGARMAKGTGGGSRLGGTIEG